MKRYTPSKGTAIALSIIFGVLGVQYFYVRRNGAGIACLLCSILLCWTVFVPIIIAAAGVIQGIRWAFYSETQWDAHFGD